MRYPIGLLMTLVAEYYFLMLGVFDLEAEAGIVYPIMASAWVSIPYAVTAACLGTLLAMIAAVALKIDERPDYLRFRRIVGMLNAVAILFCLSLGQRRPIFSDQPFSIFK